MKHKVVTDFENGRHVCRPTKTTVQPGDTVEWTPDSKASVSFGGNSPFVEGQGPFPPGSFSTVKSAAALSPGEEFVPEVDGEPVEGGIIIDRGN